MKRSANIMIADQDASPIPTTTSPWDPPSGLRSVPVLGPMTPLHSPSSEEDIEDTSRFFGALARQSRSSLGVRRPSVTGHRASLSARKGKENSRSSCGGRKANENRTRENENGNRENLQPAPAQKRLKVEQEIRLPVPLGECKQQAQRAVSSSAPTTAGSTPSTTPQNSPLRPLMDTPKHGLADRTQVDYNSLSVDELRELLGVTGTDIAAGWDKEDLIATLMTLEEAIADMPALTV